MAETAVHESEAEELAHRGPEAGRIVGATLAGSAGAGVLVAFRVHRRR